MDLTSKQQRFVNAYLGEANGNATEAARLAGYKWPDRLGPRMAGKSSIREAISRQLAAAGLSRNQVLAWLYEIASGGMSHVVEVVDETHWQPKLETAKRRGRFNLIKKLKSTEFGTEIETYSRMDAIDRLARYHGLYDTKLDELTKKVDEFEKRMKAKQFNHERGDSDSEDG